MDLLWPGFLLLLLLIPLSVAGYIWVLRRRKRFTVRFSSLSLIRAALPRYSRLRRHLPFALLLAAFASLIFALVRPVTVVAVPTNQTTIMLAIDVSRSMCSTDIQPSRLIAAENAAISFIEGQKYTTHIGIVAFSGFAELIHTPTTDKQALRDAIHSLRTGRRTGIGSGILESIDAIAEIDPSVAPSVNEFSSALPPEPVPNGAFAPSIIVLLTDGASNVGILPVDAAQQALDRGIRVYTIGFGTAQGSEFPNCGDQFMGREPFGGGQQFGNGPGGNFRRGIDEETLKQIADMTGGIYYSAESGSELQSVFQSLPTNLIVKHDVMEISVGFIAIGVLLAMSAVVLSMLWHPIR
ncbi:MAG: VWA domain-containing protein [Chloroflexi bacterium]|nr:VWA domain-containing protein [Chloroflexota bacterium]MCC6891824.1 VWA domain-containing protein [Anaerolineae bacterium]